MDRFLVAGAFSLFLFSTGSVHAACVSEMQCDHAGVCTQVEVCEDAVDMAHASPGAMTPIPGAADPMVATPAAATATDSSCREVDICGTMTMVCD